MTGTYEFDGHVSQFLASLKRSGAVTGHPFCFVLEGELGRGCCRNGQHDPIIGDWKGAQTYSLHGLAMTGMSGVWKARAAVCS